MGELPALVLATLFVVVVLALVVASFKTPEQSVKVQLWFVTFDGPIIAFPVVAVGVVVLIVAKQIFAN